MKIEFDSLLGIHELSGAFFDAVDEPPYDGCDYSECSQVLRFTIDGNHYEAVEDPDDGYRSSLREIRTTYTPPTNRFPPVKVIGRKKPKSEKEYSGEDDILQFLHSVTGGVIIEIGTSDIDDYYPGYVALFSPENLTPMP